MGEVEAELGLGRSLVGRRCSTADEVSGLLPDSHLIPVLEELDPFESFQVSEMIPKSEPAEVLEFVLVGSVVVEVEQLSRSYSGLSSLYCGLSSRSKSREYWITLNDGGP